MTKPLGCAREMYIVHLVGGLACKQPRLGLVAVRWRHCHAYGLEPMARSIHASPLTHVGLPLHGPGGRRKPGCPWRTPAMAHTHGGCTCTATTGRCRCAWAAGDPGKGWQQRQRSRTGGDGEGVGVGWRCSNLPAYRTALQSRAPELPYILTALQPPYRPLPGHPCTWPRVARPSTFLRANPCVYVA